MELERPRGGQGRSITLSMPSEESRTRLIEELLPIAHRLADQLSAWWRIDDDVRDDWRQVAAIAVIKVVDAPAPEVELSTEDRVRRQVRDDIRTLCRRRLRERNRYSQTEVNAREINSAVEPSEPKQDLILHDGCWRGNNSSAEFIRARSLDPQTDTVRDIEDIGMVQVMMFAQTMKHHPLHALERMARLPELTPENKQRLLEWARSVNNRTYPWLTPAQAEAVLLVIDLELTQEEAAQVLGRSREAVKKSVGQFRSGTRKRNPQPL